MRIDIDSQGTITRVTPDAPRGDASLLGGPTVAGMPNVHSHAFQRAFAGRAERRLRGDDSFWTWRDAMYGLAARISPDDLEAIAAQLYVEMLEAGYTAVGEFHYVHHAIGGVPYARRSEMAQRLIAAAAQTGIGMTLLPVLYRWSGFGATAPLPEQARFINDVDAFFALFDELAPFCRTPNLRLGIAPHSLRAVTPADLRAAIAALDERDPGAPIHLHIAEQAAEVDAAIAATGQRPIALLSTLVELSPRWCLIHATHIDATEIAAVGAAGAVIGICPTTEANLGDGVFPLAAWERVDGALAIGSDSHVGIDVREELRWLEYVQRLQIQRRTITPSPETLYTQAARGGGIALGRPLGVIAPGARADLVVLDPSDPVLYGEDHATLLDRYVISGREAALRDVYVGGEHVVQNGRHREREAIAARFRRTLAKLTAAPKAQYA